MANPFLVLGGIAVGVITATFGILQVPGWVASAQDAAAINDLAGIRAAEAFAMSTRGTYVTDLSLLEDGDYGVALALSGGVELIGVTTTADSFCATVKSASGAYFTAHSRTTALGKGTTPEESATDAACTGAFPGAGNGTTEEEPVEDQITFTVNSSTALDIGLPLVDATGTITWSDGQTDTVDHGIPAKRHVDANVEYKVTFEGTFRELNAKSAGLTTPEKLGFRSVDSWTGDTGTTSMSHAFDGMENLSAVPEKIPSGITDMSFVFYKATHFNDDISKWDTSSVTTMWGMFSMATSFDQPLAGWDTSEVTSMEQMFGGATVFDQPIGGWDVRKVETMQHMFLSAPEFNQPLNEWKTDSLKNARNLFQGAQSFNQPLDKWHMSNVTTIEGMFRGALAFNQPIGNWVTGNVLSMLSTFNGAASFNQDLSGWDTSKVTNAGSFATGSALSSQNLPAFPPGV